jgi:hypothetical protein
LGRLAPTNGIHEGASLERRPSTGGVNECREGGGRFGAEARPIAEPTRTARPEHNAGARRSGWVDESVSGGGRHRRPQLTARSSICWNDAPSGSRGTYAIGAFVSMSGFSGTPSAAKGIRAVVCAAKVHPIKCQTLVVHKGPSCSGNKGVSPQPHVSIRWPTNGRHPPRFPLELRLEKDGCSCPAPSSGSEARPCRHGEARLQAVTWGKECLTLNTTRSRRRAPSAVDCFGPRRSWRSIERKLTISSRLARRRGMKSAHGHARCAVWRLRGRKRCGITGRTLIGNSAHVPP